MLTHKQLTQKRERRGAKRKIAQRAARYQRLSEFNADTAAWLLKWKAENPDDAKLLSKPPLKSTANPNK